MMPDTFFLVYFNIERKIKWKYIHGQHRERERERERMKLKLKIMEVGQ